MKNKPDIRFDGFNYAWELRKFEDLLDDKEGVRRGPFGSALKKEFFVESSDYVVYEQQNAIYDNYETRYNITEEKYKELNRFNLDTGDFIMSGAGTIGRISRVPDGIKTGVFNQALIRFRINDEITDPEYFIQFIRADKMQKNLTGANPGSAITNLVPMTEVKKWDILVPCKNEQTQIGAFFQFLDNLITLHQRELENYKLLKKGFSQKLFPSNGDTNPSIRFDGFTDAWELRRLGELAKITMGQSPNSENYTENPTDHILVQGNADMKNGRVFPRVWTTQITKTADKNDLILSVRAPVGDVGKTDYNVVLGRGVAAIKGNEFLFQLLGKMKENGYWTKLSTGSTFDSINSNDIKKAEILLPRADEQDKIGLFLANLDTLITLHQRELDNYKELKKGFLQKMFV
ncbi:restriction endonuclease subunit S [Erysipelothrix rhusiopathiae]|uniref:restriction endonuclease subunit S n=1 Tax=Erysipelothrix rhusiopathiae TaxID=1648 RepID=UPI0039E87048